MKYLLIALLCFFLASTSNVPAQSRHSLAREFPESKISRPPVANETPPLNEAFKHLQAGEFAAWRLSVDGLVERPASFSLAQLKSYPSRSQITQLQCEEGWSYIAEWIGVPRHVLDLVGICPQARYVAHFSIDPDWRDSIDIADALHPQTFLAYGMNGNELPVGNGGPLRIRLPRHGKGSASASPESGSYACYAGI
jgi:DMSO/TMAO reductase YedYZ molybdopterin-dependent catalytic subunit